MRKAALLGCPWTKKATTVWWDFLSLLFCKWKCANLSWVVLEVPGAAGDHLGWGGVGEAVLAAVPPLVDRVPLTKSAPFCCLACCEAVPVMSVILAFLCCNLGSARVALTCCCVLPACRRQRVRSGLRAGSRAPVGLVAEKGFPSLRIVCVSRSGGGKGSNPFVPSRCTAACWHTPRRSFVLSALGGR